MKSLAFLVFLYLVMPGSGQLVWDGLPLSTRAEVASLTLFVIVFLSREMRRTLAEIVGRPNWNALTKPILVVLCAAKFLSFAWAPIGSGFASCYRGIYFPLEDRGACEKSYEAPFSQGMGATYANSSRMDRVVDFGEFPYDWSLPFVNDFPRLRNLWLERIPFSASFAVRLRDSDAEQVLPVFGIGEVSANVNGLEVARAENYARDFVLAVPLPADAADVVVGYEYRDDELAIPPEVAPEPRGPYARLKIGEPMSVADLAAVSRVRLTGDFTSSNSLGTAHLAVLDRDGKTVTIDDVNARRAASSDEHDALLRPFDLEIEIPATALLDGPLTLQGVSDNTATQLATIMTAAGTLAPSLAQSRASADLVRLGASLTTDREALTPLAPGVRDTPTIPLRALLALLDLITFSILAALLYVVVRAMRKDLLHAAGFAALGWLAIKPLDSILPAIFGGGRELVIPYAIIAATAVLAYRRQIDRYPIPFLLPLATVLSTQKIFEHLYFNHPEQRPSWWGKLFYYWRDSDWFVARGNARAIFTTGSLRANDPVFFSQAASRYLSYFSNSLLGEQDVLIGLISLTLGFVVVLVLASRIANVHPQPTGRTLAIGAAFISLVFLGDQLIVAFAFFISSEYPTWIGLLGVTAYLINPQREHHVWKITAVAAMLAILVHFRPNSVFVSIAIVIYLVLSKVDWREDSVGLKQFGWSTAAFIVVVPLSLLHNLFYGDTFMPFTGNASINYAFNWTEIWSTEGFSGAISTIWSQLRTLMYWRVPNDPNYAIFFWGSQAMLLVAICLRVRKRLLSRTTSLLIFLPVVYIAPMLKFQYTSYFPRFVVAASLLCLCSALMTWPKQKELL